jgi:hypothetical protein
MRPLLDKPVPFYARRSMAAAALGSDIYFWGGVGADTRSESILDVSNELWKFDTLSMNWSEIGITDSWPSPRRCGGWLPFDKGIYLWGGSGLKTDAKGRVTYNFLNDLWLFNPDGLTWHNLEPSDDHALCPHKDTMRPLPRYTPVSHGHNNQLTVFGGYTEDLLGKRKMNDLWVRNDNGEWREITSRGLRHGYSPSAEWPGLRYGSMSASHNEMLYMCGGFSDEGDHIDLWELDCRNIRWRSLSPDAGGDDVPLKRYCAAMVYFEGALYLFGGRSRRYPKLNFNDLWRFSFITLQWEKIHDNREPHRYGHDADFPAYHAKSAIALSGHKMYVWGGEGRSGHVSDFWYLDLKSLEWSLIQAARPDDPVLW